MKYTFKRVNEDGYVLKEHGHTLFPEDVRKKLNQFEKLQNKNLKQIAILENTMLDIEVPAFFKKATGKDYRAEKISVNDIRRLCMLFWNQRINNLTK